MAQEFSSILTVRGRQKLAAALAGGAPVQLTHMAIGDGRAGAYYSPTETQVALENEVFRAPINRLAQDTANPAWAVSELVIPDEIGGFYVREVGVFDADGELFCIGKFPESFKPTLPSGAGKQLYVRQILEVSNVAAITLIIDPSLVTATRQYVDELLGNAIATVTDRLDRNDPKNSARAATTAPIALASLQTIDGVVLSPGNRVLVKDQANGGENGIYIAAAGVWVRAADADTSAKVTAGLTITIEEGVQFGGSMWQLITPSPIVLGTTALQFVLAAGRTGIAAGTYNNVTFDNRGRAISGTHVWVPRYLRAGDPLPAADIGPIWHDDYNDWMTWHVFDQNGANYTGYASRLIGKPELDAQPTPRKGFIASGTTNLLRTDFAAIRNWGIHNGIMVAPGAWNAGEILIADNPDGLTFRLYDLRGEFLRAWSNGSGVDPGRGFGTWQNDAIRNITGVSPTTYGRFDPGGTGAIMATSLANSSRASPNISGSYYEKFDFDASRVVPTAPENRGRNTALLASIKF